MIQNLKWKHWFPWKHSIVIHKHSKYNVNLLLLINNCRYKTMMFLININLMSNVKCEIFYYNILTTELIKLNVFNFKLVCSLNNMLDLHIYFICTYIKL